MLKEIKVNSTTVYEDDLAEDIEIRFKDLMLVGSNFRDDYYYPIIYNHEGPVIWIRTKRFRFFEGQKIICHEAIHIMYVQESYSDFVSRAVITSDYVIPNDCYGYFALTVDVNAFASMEETNQLYVTIRSPRYSKEEMQIDEPNGHILENMGIDANDVHWVYKNNGLSAVSSQNVIRNAAFAYDGDIIYQENRFQGSINFSFGVSANYEKENWSYHLNLQFATNTNNANLIFMYGLGMGWYNIEKITFENTFQNNINGIKIEIKNKNLIVTYVYEGQIYTNTAPVSSLFQVLYDRCEHKACCIIQTGADPNIDSYNRGFKNYADYFRFVRTLNDDSQLVDHSYRISVLEEGGGSVTPSDLDWSKGYDLLEFGQEYLYAWLTALHNNNSFKVLFTGDSTTAYYSGSSDGLKEIFQNCMEKFGYTNGTYVNRAISGINASYWRTKCLSGDISEQPTLYIIRHGFNNEPGDTEDDMAEAFRLEMIQSLETIRQTLTISNTSIILMTPNTSDDDINHRGYSMKKKLDPIIRNLARVYGCGFIDTFRIWYDAGTYADPMYDDPYGDHRSIHPTGLMNRIIVSKIIDFCVPIAYRTYTS